MAALGLFLFVFVLVMPIVHRAQVEIWIQSNPQGNLEANAVKWKRQYGMVRRTLLPLAAILLVGGITVLATI
jgi:hypothetical protein